MWSTDVAADGAADDDAGDLRSASASKSSISKS
jgi:hypothetical protein